MKHIHRKPNKAGKACCSNCKDKKPCKSSYIARLILNK